MGEWKVSIQRCVDRLGCNIFIYRNCFDNTEQLLHGKIVRIERGEAVPPTMYLDDSMMRALTDSIHSEFKPPEGKFTEGELVATKKHLQDMRQILKIK